MRCSGGRFGMINNVTAGGATTVQHRKETRRVRERAWHPGLGDVKNGRGPDSQICLPLTLWSLKLHLNPCSSYFSHFNPAQLLLLSALPQPGQAESERQ